MVRAKMKEEDGGSDNTQNGAEKPIDAKRAVKILREDILPNLTKIGERSQEVSTAYKAITKGCNIPSWVVKLAIKLHDTEDYKRDHELRAMQAMFAEYGIAISEDLVDQAEGKTNAGGIIPTKKQTPKPRLVTVSNGSETDLADAAKQVVEEQDEFDKAAPNKLKKPSFGDGSVAGSTVETAE